MDPAEPGKAIVNGPDAVIPSAAEVSVDVVIPVYNPGRDGKLLQALTRLYSQTQRPGRVILMNTEESLYRPWAEKENVEKRFPDLIVRHLSVGEFDHAATRNAGAALSDAPYILYMTMDAVPADNDLIRSLRESFSEHRDCAIAYARHLPDEGADLPERCARALNYPSRPMWKTLEDEKRLGIRASFASNVCAMYSRRIFDELGGFRAPAIFNEDMVFAHAALHAGYGICYCADARVIHSHNYSAGEQFHRNFDLGVSQAMHPEVFSGVSSEKEGIVLVRMSVRKLAGHGQRRKIPGYLFTCAARYAGYFLGKRYRRLPRRLVLKCTNQPVFWTKTAD